MKKLFLLIVMSICLCSCFKKYNTINISLPVAPKILNPQLAVDESSKFILFHLFEGLTQEDNLGRIIPAVAESWTVKEKIWTFKINKNAKWQNGKSVTANNFVSAWEKVLNSNSKNENAHYFYIIKGAYEYNKAQVANFDSVGIKAIDENTLQVELTDEIDYFDRIVAQTVFYPLNEEFYEKHQDRYGKDRKNILGNGLYKITDFDINKGIVLTKYEIKKPNKNNNELERIAIKIVSKDEKKYELYSKKLLDVFDYNSEVSDKNLKKNEFYSGEMQYIGFGTANKVFSNAKIRKAINLVIDKNLFVSKFTLKNKPGTQYIPKNIDETKGINSVEFSANKAKLYLSEGLKELSMNINDLENLTLMVKANSKEKEYGNFIVNQINKNLGLNIRVITKSSQMFDQKIGSSNYYMALNIFKPQLIQDIEYQEFYNSILIKLGDNSYGEILKNIYKEKNIQSKNNLLENADSILIEESPLIPISFSKKLYIVRNKVKKISFSNLIGVLDLRNVKIEE